MTDEEVAALVAHWPASARDAVLSQFDCQECGMHQADWRYFLQLEAENAAQKEIAQGYHDLLVLVGDSFPEVFPTIHEALDVIEREQKAKSDA